MANRGSKFRLGIVGLVVLAIVTAGVVAASLRPAPSADTSGFTPSPPAIATPTIVPNVAFIGDSYTAGIGTSNPRLRWTSLLTAEMDWVEQNLGQGGTGYLVTTSKACGKDYCPNFQEMAAETSKVEATVVMVSGGRNEYKLGLTELEPAIAATMQKIRATVPDAKIIALSPLWDDDPVPAGLTEMGDVVRAQVEAVGGTYLDLGQPLAGRPDLIAPDGGHPNDAGHAEIARVVRDKVNALGDPFLSHLTL